MPQYDYVDKDGKTVAARIDLIVGIAGRRWRVDVTIPDADSDDPALRRQRAARSGHAAEGAEDGKRRKYGPSVIPLAWETGGRLGPAGASFLKRLYSTAEEGALQRFLQEVGCIIAAGAATAARTARGS